MKKSTLIMILSLVLAVALGVGGTLAYLQDTDEDVNVMTLGNVYIEQHEYERVQKENGEYEMVTSEKYGEGYKLQEFTQGKPLYPAVGEVTDYGDIVAFDQLGEGASGSQAVLDGIQNAQDKFVLVENTGKSDAYVRTIFAFEMGTMDSLRWDEIFMTSVASFTNNGDKPWKYTDIGTAVIDGNTYFLMEAVYTGADTRHVDGVLPAGEYTYCSLAQVYLKPEANNEDMVALDGNGNGTFDILVVSQAVQTQGFADAKTALDTAFGPITVDNNPWKEDGEDLDGTPVFPDLNAPVNGDDDTVTFDIPADAYRVTSTEELEAAVAAGKTTILLADGEYNARLTATKGKTLKLYGESKNAVLLLANEGELGADYDFDGSNVTFTGLTISSQNSNGTYPGYARMAATYNDCVIDQTYSLYTGDNEFNYCTLNVSGDKYNVWTWGANTAEFNRCTFNSDGKAVLLYGGANTKLTLESCLFNDNGALSDLKAAVEIGNDYGTSYELIVNNTTVNGYEINDKGINTGTTLWGNKNSMSTEKLNVVVDGVDVY